MSDVDGINRTLSFYESAFINLIISGIVFFAVDLSFAYFGFSFRYCYSHHRRYGFIIECEDCIELDETKEEIGF
jgi:hypothetical protein